MNYIKEKNKNKNRKKKSRKNYDVNKVKEIYNSMA